MKKFWIETFGCQMNVYDGVRIKNLLQSLGYVEAEALEQADIILLNTCHIREKAAEKVFAKLGRIKKALERIAKRQVGGLGSEVVIGVIGCVAKAMGAEIFRRAPFVSIVVSSQKYHLLPEIITKSFDELLEVGKARHIDVSVENGIEKFDNLPTTAASEKIAFVAIQEGCDKYCTYCVVPYTRGREVSRPVADVLAEVANLDKLGVMEINLLGQNVDAYHGVDENGVEQNLAYIIREVAKFENVKRIRYTTSYPTQLGEELMQLHATEPKMMPFIYLPIQAGSDNVLKKMNRRYTQAEYLKTVARLREIRPDIQISSDFIVGFVGETDEDFQETLKVVEKVGFIHSYSFKYSRRPGTAGDRMPEAEHIDEDVKAARLAVLQKAFKDKQNVFYQACVGKTFDVFFEYKGEKTGLWLGRTEYMQPVLVNSDEDLKDKILSVKIDSAGHSVLKGSLVK